MIRWLHISDLHLGNEDLTSSCMRDDLISFLEQQDYKFDYIFLTGDILTAGPDASFTQEMGDFLKKICEAAGVAYDRMYITPGNHDINRNAEGRDDSIKKAIYDRSGYYDPRKGDISKDDLMNIWAGQVNFRNFLSSIYSEEHLAYYLDAQQPHFVIETEDFNIIHLDTTISYTEGQEATDLIVGLNPLYKVLNKTNKKKPSVLITHYPITSLLQDEKKTISIYLQKRGVRLWLAGHEHDHNLQRIKYLNMMQAGVMRYGQGEISSFIIGQYDPDDFKAEAMVYMWFDEGWAQYPFVDLDAKNPKIFSFELKPIDENCVPKLTLKAREANENALLRLTDKLDKSIFPKLKMQNKENDLNGILEAAWKSDKRNVILYGEGGMGKSTMLLTLCKESAKPILYVSAEYLAAIKLKLEDYVRDIMFNGNNEKFHLLLSERNSNQSLIVTVDGLNEVDAENEGRIIREIQRMSIFKGLQFLIASRVDFTVRYNLPSFCKAKIEGLEEFALRNYFSVIEWKSISDSKNLLRLIKNPMLATIYKEVCSVIDEFIDVEFLDWKLPIESSTDLFYNYYLGQIALMMNRNGGVDKKRLMSAIICIRQVLPAIAYEYELSFSINKLNKDFRTLLSRIVGNLRIDEEMLESVKNHFRYWNNIDFNEHIAFDAIINELNLLHCDGKFTSFSHQMYRDYLSAQHIIQTSKNEESISEIWNSRLIPSPIADHINNGIEMYWNGLALKIKKVAEKQAYPQIILNNIFCCFPSSISGGIADLSNLNLSNILLPNFSVMENKVSLKNSNIDLVSLGLNNEALEIYRVLAISDDQRFLAAAAAKKLEIYDIWSNTQPFTFDIGKIANKMIFHENRLYINAGSIIIFSFDKEWEYVGEIKLENGVVFTKKFKSLRVNGDYLNIYYKNRIIQYNLSDCSLIKQTYSQEDGRLHPDGDTLDALRQGKDTRLAVDNNQVVEMTTNGSISAISYTNGIIEMVQDGEIIRKYGKRVCVLLDAAISGDGNTIVTLSSETFDEGRRLQIWDINKKKKSKELYCDESIIKINLSERGNWILGVNEQRTWVYNIETGREYWTREEFVSNQHGKMITFGDSILKKDMDGGLQLLNLNTGEIRDINCPRKNPSIVCTLKNNTIGAVDQYGSTFYFVSDRSGELLSISNPGEKIQAIQALNGQPFIVVAATNGVVSIYHTGTGQRTRILGDTYQKVKLTAAHPSKTIFAHSDGRKNLTLEFYFTWYVKGKECGKWKSMQYRHNLESSILDLAFNEENRCLIVILSNGKILYLSENWCELKDSSHIITSFNTILR